MRLFIAIELDESIKEQLLETQRKAKSLTKKGNFSRIDHFHLTLRFIGETPEEHVPLIKTAMQQAAAETTPFDLTLSGLGTFQKRNRYVLWTGVEANPALMDLQKKIEDQLEHMLGLSPERRPYTPHITVGRNIRFEENWETTKEQIIIPPMTQPVSNITLFHSTQKDGRLQYLPLARAAFNDK